MCEKINLLDYDKYIVSFSGGKDSTACFLYLLDHGVPIDHIELWHQEIDGREKTFMDWEITPDYCRKFAEAFGVKIYFQWKLGGFKREMLRRNSLTAPVAFELPDGSLKHVGGVRGKPSTRMKFPQISPDLKVRWCSSYLKIDVCKTAIINQDRFQGIRTIVISGERGEESPQRAKYAIFEPDKADLRNGKEFTRHVDRFRPLRDWKESQVWEIISRYRVRVHPCYYLGWPRCSCKFCIFSNSHQFASAASISTCIANELIIYENKFGCTIKRNTSLESFLSSGTPYKHITPETVRLVTNRIYDQSIIIPPSEPWMLPAGAYGHTG